MATSKLFAKISETPAVQSLLRRLENGGVLSLNGISASAQPFLAALLRQLLPELPIVLVSDSLKTQESFQQDVETWLNFEGSQQKSKGKAPASQPSTISDRPLFYPAWEVMPHESKLPHADVISERLETLVALARQSPGKRGAAPHIIANVTALLQKTFPASVLKERTRMLNRGDRVEPLDLIEWLEEQGYEPEAQVTQKGEIALRGGILDVYPMTSPWPVRLEFFGDELESLRYFDPITQISREQIATVTLPPGGEFGILKQLAARDQQASLATLLDYLPTGTLFILSEPERIEEHTEQYSTQVPNEDPFHIPWSDFQELLSEKGMKSLQLSEIVMDGESEGMDVLSESEAVAEDERPFGESTENSLPFSSLEAFRPLGARAPEPQIAEAQRREFFAQLHRWSRQGYDVHLFCNNDGERQRFQEVWKDYGFGEDFGLKMHLGALGRGFLNEEAKVVVVTDAEIFGRYKVQRPRRLKSPHAQATRSALDIDFTELEEGDYVVHLQHGIGRYQGLKVLPVTLGRKGVDPNATPADSGQECLVIEYAASDPQQPAPKLYVPVTEAHLVSKYVGAGKARPQLNTIGGTRWAKAKAQAERAVRDVASELLAIQAARESQPGYSFKADTPWQREFESAFLYEETRDQMRAINETKGDMERPKPMDRLICGDVGFGKTEVAIRAAFKAVMEGKQVAILVPTTVLAQQHYNTFKERVADYPMRVELLSRFRSPKNRKRVISELPAGAVDIVIGTHRLIQSDINFKDLGLVIIDEEQRFGVLHKEKFKQIRKLVDVLTLSATPIPRTLYLALTGARDMSTIETPPQDRLPVETIVAQYDERLIREAIQRELNRGGQVYFLHNRVGTIDAMAQKLRTLVPHARIVVGHGQMKPDDLEEVMTAFINGEADVLLSTTIIESGLDIPNANTMIIDRADRFGLSDLYQLRGRVGRYKHQAYAYLLLPRHAGLLADARKRISALKQYSTLGSGFKIAMRDLEIRGAGNMLGPEQSGQITAVGFDLYCQLLKQSVAALKGEKVKPRVEVQVRFDFLALNPGEESAAPERGAKAEAPKRRKAEPEIIIPREVLTYVEYDEVAEQKTEQPMQVEKGSAFIPLSYVSEAKQRIDIYRKLAQATDKAALENLAKELRDRFGTLPPAMELLLQVGELKILAGEKNITIIEVKDDKLMLTRNNDYIMLGGKFPRLTKGDAKGRLKEIKKLLLAL
ncbi:transcription-repair coupling factor [Pedosphaera parvula]|uniref:Transcription-repair-coupling factor n=1 Tax=Pedosphaera parvula (strain Ellin514) TaxID=320771 RepID=B9XRJ1_PEDPL|nr:transcription-repair coupling factor [Pedosphaera parvula]EEF57562.1 transcription-repair coupling factor [Pedosphaera parvula Ellin514]